MAKENSGTNSGGSGVTPGAAPELPAAGSPAAGNPAAGNPAAAAQPATGAGNTVNDALRGYKGSGAKVTTREQEPKAYATYLDWVSDLEKSGMVVDPTTGLWVTDPSGNGGGGGKGGRGGSGGSSSKSSGINGQQQIGMLQQEYELARQQYNAGLDNAMSQEALDLNRALSDAQRMYQTQRSQVTADERNSLDNAALYAEARGDKGGIGLAQYNSIQNTAAQNRLAVSQAQTQMATDVYRQIADLRAEGEFKRADKMLELAQQHLAELRQIQQYAQQYNLSTKQINQAIEDWKKSYAAATQQYSNGAKLAGAALTGAFGNGTPVTVGAANTSQAVADIALGLLQSGISPAQLTPVQRSALAETYGMTYSV